MKHVMAILTVALVLGGTPVPAVAATSTHGPASARQPDPAKGANLKPEKAKSDPSAGRIMSRPDPVSARPRLYRASEDGNFTVSYAGFAHAYGGDWAARLRLAELPACVLT